MKLAALLISGACALELSSTVVGADGSEIAQRLGPRLDTAHMLALPKPVHSDSSPPPLSPLRPSLLRKLCAGFVPHAGTGLLTAGQALH